MCFKKRDFYIFLILLLFVGYAVIQRLSAQPADGNIPLNGDAEATFKTAPVSQSAGSSNISATFGK